jgi:superfamily II DNA or RNA helicase
MILRVRKGVQELVLDEPTRTHTLALTRRALLSRGLDAHVEDPAACVAALEYLGRRVEVPDVLPEAVAARHGLEKHRLLRALGPLRDDCHYREYLGEWIQEGKPSPLAITTHEATPDAPAENQSPDDLGIATDTLEDDWGKPEAWGDLEPLVVEDAEPWASSGSDVGSAFREAQELPEADPDDPHLLEPAPPLPQLLQDEAEAPPSNSALPSRWRAPFHPYAWQFQAADAWERSGGRGIMQVVTGAGKTALAILLYARLLDRASTKGVDPLVIVVVPRVALVKQWRIAFQQLLDLSGLRLGEYHGAHRCFPAIQDILIITQDSARNLIPRLRLGRPTLLIADECHRLGAPAASRVFRQKYQWTLGLSATPERGGDLGLQAILVPNLGPIIWTYGYRQAVQDGIIARFALLRVRVEFLEQEKVQYVELSERVKRLLDALKATYPRLRYARSFQFWQVMGDLKRRHADDDRFQALTATSSSRRMIVHLAARKFEAVREIARALPGGSQVLCFHERIEAADRLLSIVHNEQLKGTIYHTGIPEPQRSKNLERFRAAQASWLVACRSLDEGLDIPAVDTVVVAAGTKAPRQIIQRLGRALRKKQDARQACVILLEVQGVDEDTFDQEGLAELRAAADEIVELEVSELQGWIAGPTPSEKLPQHTVAATQAPRESHLPELSTSSPEDLQRYAKRVSEPAKPSALERFVDVGRRIVRRVAPSSWTGTWGNRSYYDKDSSPD